MKKIPMILCSLIVLWGFLGSQRLAFADEGGYGLTITKYQLTKAEVAALLPTDGSKADLTDQEVVPLAGVQYRVVRVTPEAGKFVPIQGTDAFATVLTTDSEGVATLNGLPQGMYQISELPHEKVSQVMDPVVLELPLPQANGKALDHVYLYPKSGVTSIGGKLPTTGGNGENATSKPTKLPQTSGNMGSYYALISIFAMIVVLGVLGIISLNKKQRTL